MIDKDKLCIGFNTGDIQVLNISTMNFIYSLNSHNKEITSLVRHNDTTIASGSKDTRVKIWDIETKTIKIDLDIETKLNKFMTNSLKIKIYTLSKNKICILDADIYSTITILDYITGISQSCSLNNGPQHIMKLNIIDSDIIVYYIMSIIVLRDAKTLNIIHEFKHKEPIYSINILPDMRIVIKSYFLYILNPITKEYDNKFPLSTILANNHDIFITRDLLIILSDNIIEIHN